MDIYHTIIRPLVTEKSTKQSQSTSKRHGGVYSFEVHAGASKQQIRDAVQKIYGVKVVDVRTVNRPGKPRRFRFQAVTSPQTKKAMIVVDKDSHIDLF